MGVMMVSDGNFKNNENKQQKIEGRGTAGQIFWGRGAMQFCPELNVYFVVWYNTVS